MLTLFKCPLITENKHLLRDPELSIVTRNCQIYIMPLDTLKTGIYKLKDFMNCIKVKRNNLLNSLYSSVSPDFRFKGTPYVNFFTDPELSSSLCIIYVQDGRSRGFFSSSLGRGQGTTLFKLLCSKVSQVYLLEKSTAGKQNILGLDDQISFFLHESYCTFDGRI